VWWINNGVQIVILAMVSRVFARWRSSWEIAAAIWEQGASVEVDVRATPTHGPRDKKRAANAAAQVSRLCHIRHGANIRAAASPILFPG